MSESDPILVSAPMSGDKWARPYLLFIRVTDFATSVLEWRMPTTQIHQVSRGITESNPSYNPGHSQLDLSK